MIGDNSSLVLGGRALSDRLIGAMPALTREVVAALDFDGDVSRTVQKALKSFCRVLITREQPTPSDLAWVRESAARRAEEGLPIDAVLTAYHVGASVCTQVLHREAEPDDVAACRSALPWCTNSSG